MKINTIFNINFKKSRIKLILLIKRCFSIILILLNCEDFIFSNVKMIADEKYKYE